MTDRPKHARIEPRGNLSLAQACDKLYAPVSVTYSIKSNKLLHIIDRIGLTKTEVARAMGKDDATLLSHWLAGRGSADGSTARISHENMVLLIDVLNAHGASIDASGLVSL